MLKCALIATGLLLLEYTCANIEANAWELYFSSADKHGKVITSASEEQELDIARKGKYSRKTYVRYWKDTLKQNKKKSQYFLSDNIKTKQKDNIILSS